jgi:hypothetical protein
MRLQCRHRRRGEVRRSSSTRLREEVCVRSSSTRQQTNGAIDAPKVQAALPLLHKPLPPKVQAALPLLSPPLPPKVQAALPLLSPPLAPKVQAALPLLSPPLPPKVQAALTQLDQPLSPIARADALKVHGVPPLLNQPLPPKVQAVLPLLNPPLPPMVQTARSLRNPFQPPAAQRRRLISTSRQQTNGTVVTLRRGKARPAMLQSMMPGRGRPQRRLPTTEATRRTSLQTRRHNWCHAAGEEVPSLSATMAPCSSSVPSTHRAPCSQRRELPPQHAHTHHHQHQRSCTTSGGNRGHLRKNHSSCLSACSTFGQRPRSWRQEAAPSAPAPCRTARPPPWDTCTHEAEGLAQNA